MTAMSKYQIERDKEQQEKLSSKLNERLGDSQVYFKRDVSEFYHNLSLLKRQELLDKLKSLYFQILVDYFTDKDNINHLIDRFLMQSLMEETPKTALHRFAEEAFFVNLPMNKVVEIHLELIDKLERQLKFEGLHTEHLCDFRLTLIDVVTHLGEMYRSVIYNRI